MVGQTIKYWQEHALNHIMPDRGSEFPEGEHILKRLAELCEGNTLDFGCGRGRIAPFFDPKKYLGADISEPAIIRAICNNPMHWFRLIEPFEPLPKGDTVLAYTVLHHITDEDLPKVLDQLRPFPRIVIAEIMEPSMTSTNMPPCINRESYPFHVEHRETLPNHAYPGIETTILVCRP